MMSNRTGLVLTQINKYTEMEGHVKGDVELFLERVWQCGYGCFSNNFSCQNACQ